MKDKQKSATVILPGRQGPLLTWINLIQAWISNYSHYKVYDEITFPFPNFNGAKHNGTNTYHNTDFKGRKVVKPPLE